MPPQSYHKVLAVVVVDAIVDEAVGEDAQRLVRPEHRERLLIRDRIRPHAHTLHDLGHARHAGAPWPGSACAYHLVLEELCG
jgi:hypothetical protein